VFVSHETYTPARGGSAAAEIHALRQVFGEDADRIVIANTKGFTGHPMGVGLEDVLAVKALETGIVPPVPNFKDADPELGSLNLSKGGEHPVYYALRLAAGFGSQIGWRPRSAAASAASTTMAAAPIPMIMPWRRRSKGIAASATRSSVAAAPLARNPLVTQGSSSSLVTSSAETITTRRHRPTRIQSWATDTACVVLAHAAFSCVFGPRAPISSANCE